MCPVVLLTFLYSLICLLTELTSALTVNYGLSELRVKEGEEATVNFTFTDKIQQPWANDEFFYYQIKVSSPRVATITSDQSIKLDRSILKTQADGMFNYSGSATILGKLLGHTNLHLEYIPFNSSYGQASALIADPPCSDQNNQPKASPLVLTSSSSSSITVGTTSNQLPVLVSLKHTRLEKIFTVSVVSLVLLNFINMGCAVDFVIVKSVLKKPIAPLIGFIAQYVAMPLVSYIVGYFLLNGDDYYYWFGLFAFGCSPGGNASNMWTLLLGGNLNLSLTMTFLSTFSALFMIPLWLFTLGVHIKSGPSKFNVPYLRIFETLVAMAFFLGIGLLFQKYLPKVARTSRRILAPLSTAMIIFIVLFSTYVYWSMIKLLTWKILLSAGLNVWFGFLIGYGLSLVFNFNNSDKLAIAVETGVQNTGISIMLIRLALQPPESDLATLLPVAASLMTPIPLTILLIIKRFQNCGSSSKEIECDSPGSDISRQKHRTSPMSPENSLINGKPRNSWISPRV